ncbi:hypothetical protein Tco_1042478 [Tanacetum coccineum]|uniref:Jacalin-type lectin domain-containing protein n=1 Tax=Tanacetum coccineum TaxID=301880 RepID=A0ABQ5GJT8_9ASTR
MACLATITSRFPSLFKSKRTHDSINNVINAIVEMRIYFHDVTIKMSQEHTVWKIGDWICSSTFNSFDKEGDGLTFNGKKSMNIIGSWKVGGIWSLGFLRILKRSKVPLVGEHGLNIVRNFEDLTELGKSESYEFVLNHKGDDKISIFIGLNRDLTIEIKNESWNNRFVDFKETIEANVCEETLNVVGFVVGLINNTTFVNVAIFNGFVEFAIVGGNAGDFGYF